MDANNEPQGAEEAPAQNKVKMDPRPRSSYQDIAFKRRAIAKLVLSDGGGALPNTITLPASRTALSIAYSLGCSERFVWNVLRDLNALRGQGHDAAELVRLVGERIKKEGTGAMVPVDPSVITNKDHKQHYLDLVAYVKHRTLIYHWTGTEIRRELGASKSHQGDAALQEAHAAMRYFYSKKKGAKYPRQDVYVHESLCKDETISVMRSVVSVPLDDPKAERSEAKEFEEVIKQFKKHHESPLRDFPYGELKPVLLALPISYRRTTQLFTESQYKPIEVKYKAFMDRIFTKLKADNTAFTDETSMYLDTKREQGWGIRGAHIIRFVPKSPGPRMAVWAAIRDAGPAAKGGAGPGKTNTAADMKALDECAYICLIPPLPPGIVSNYKSVITPDIRYAMRGFYGYGLPWEEFFEVRNLITEWRKSVVDGRGDAALELKVIEKLNRAQGGAMELCYFLTISGAISRIEACLGSARLGEVDADEVIRNARAGFGQRQAGQDGEEERIELAHARKVNPTRGGKQAEPEGTKLRRPKPAPAQPAKEPTPKKKPAAAKRGPPAAAAAAAAEAAAVVPKRKKGDPPAPKLKKQFSATEWSDEMIRASVDAWNKFFKLDGDIQGKVARDTNVAEKRIKELMATDSMSVYIYDYGLREQMSYHNPYRPPEARGSSYIFGCGTLRGGDDAATADADRAKLVKSLDQKLDVPQEIPGAVGTGPGEEPPAGMAEKLRVTNKDLKGALQVFKAVYERLAQGVGDFGEQGETTVEVTKEEARDLVSAFVTKGNLAGYAKDHRRAMITGMVLESDGSFEDFVNAFFESNDVEIRKRAKADTTTPTGFLGVTAVFDKATYNEFLRSIPKSIVRGRSLLMDNASVHSPAKDMTWASFRKSEACVPLEGKGMNEANSPVVFIPPYSPRLNPIELFFSILKAHVKRMFERAGVKQRMTLSRTIWYCFYKFIRPMAISGLIRGVYKVDPGAAAAAAGRKEGEGEEAPPPAPMKDALARTEVGGALSAIEKVLKNKNRELHQKVVQMTRR